MKKILFALTLTLVMMGCNKEQTNVIGKSNMKIEGGRMTPEALWSLGRMSDAQVSPDGTKVLYGVTYFDIKENKSNREIFVMNADGSNNHQITKTSNSEYAAKWINNGQKIAFLTIGSEGDVQVWEMNADGSNRVQITHHKGGVSDFAFSPDGKLILFIADVKYGERTIDKYPDLDKASGRVIDELMYKHWDEWTESVPHPFLVEYDGRNLSDERDLLEGEPYECPMKPFGGIEQLAFSPDSKTIAYTCRKKTGKEYAESTNSDIYLYDIEKGETIKNLTEGMMGYDINPVFSPDGSKLAFQSMEHDGWESDKDRLMVIDLTSGERIDVSENWDQSCATLSWKDNGNIYLTSCQHGTTQIYIANVETKEFRQITTGQHDYESVSAAATGLIAMRHSMSAPNDLYLVNEATGEQKQLTNENKELLDQMEFGRVEERWMETNDHQKMLVWIIYPPHFDKNKKYATLLYCEGGPQSPVSQFWSYRWNFQMMAANDYIIVAPNRRGLYGFGKEWLEEISGDYGGKCMEDYFTAIDTFCKEPFVDTDRLGCVGASFGGYSVYWIAGHHNKRFKAFIAHDGIFNLEQQYVETEEMWFVNRDLGGAYWEKDNPIVTRSYANSPHLFVDKWDTPILCIHGEKDYRILASQGMAAFNAARLRGVPAELLIFPDENHWVLQPQNGILWQRTFAEWLNRWLQPESK